jgi:rubredoxin
MKRLRILLLVITVVVVAAPAFAGTIAGTGVVEPDYSSFDVCASTGSYTRCTDDWGCPQCQSNMSQTYSVCVKVHYAAGWCRCSSPRAIDATGKPVCGILTGGCWYTY